MIKVLAYPILIFTLVFVASGTIWLCILFGMLLFPIAYLFKRHVYLGSVTILLIIALVILMITKIDAPSFMRSTIDFISPVSSISSMPLQKYRSGTIRLTTLDDVLL